MKFVITGADAVTGEDRELSIDAVDQDAASVIAKNQGVFVSRIVALPGPSSGTTPPMGQSLPRRNQVPRIKSKPCELSPPFVFFALVSFCGAVLGGLAIGSKDPVFGCIIFASGCMGGLFLLALAKVLDYLFEVVQRLRQILRHLESKE
jgi:hypothetical protein